MLHLHKLEIKDPKFFPFFLEEKRTLRKDYARVGD